jgi:cytoskeletal protein CcmA (bactofilin family)
MKGGQKMFNKKDTPLAMDTILGEYTSVAGNIESEGSVKLLGKVEGDVKAGGDIYIEPTASITGNVYGSNIFLSGMIKGNVLAKGILHLMTQARLYGDIEVTSIVTDEGAIFQGSCRMIELDKVEETAANNGNHNINNKKNKLKSRKPDPAED